MAVDYGADPIRNRRGETRWVPWVEGRNGDKLHYLGSDFPTWAAMPRAGAVSSYASEAMALRIARREAKRQDRDRWEWA